MPGSAVCLASSIGLAGRDGDHLGAAAPSAAPVGRAARSTAVGVGRSQPAPPFALPTPGPARVPGRHGSRAHRRHRRQRRRRHHDLLGHGRHDRPPAALAVPHHDGHPGGRPGDGRAPRRGHRPGPLGPHPRPLRRALDRARHGRPAGRQPGQHRGRVRRCRRRAGHPRRAQPDHGAGRGRRHLGARAVRQLPHGREGLPGRDARLRGLHRLRLPGRPRLGRGRPGAGDARPERPRPCPAAADGRRGGHDHHAVHAVLPAVGGGREGHRRGGARPRAGGCRGRLDLDQRHRRLHRRRHGHDPLRAPARRSAARPTPPPPWARSPAGCPRCSSRSASSGPACWPPRSCR